MNKTNYNFLLRYALCAFFCTSILVSFTGCQPAPLEVTQLSEAHEKFQKICSEDFSMNIVIKHQPDTMHIYVPLDFDMLRTTATMGNPFDSSKPMNKRQINFVQTTITNDTIHIQYDITPVTSYPKPAKYTSKYTKQFSSINSSLLQALYRSYGGLTDDSEKLQFVSLLFVDTHNGIALKNVFHFKDLQMVMTAALSQDEYARRYMTEMIGNMKFVDNPQARGINFENITWPEFMAKQITYRINFKYGRSSFPPQRTDHDEILTIVQAAVHAYNFELFEQVELEDLTTGNTETIDKSELADFQ